VIVSDGIVHLWGLVGTEAEHNALLALARDVAGVLGVSDETIPSYCGPGRVGPLAGVRRPENRN
jgi:hypothetical protein